MPARLRTMWQTLHLHLTASNGCEEDKNQISPTESLIYVCGESRLVICKSAFLCTFVAKNNG